MYYFEGDLLDSVISDVIIVNFCNLQGDIVTPFSKKISEEFPEASESYKSLFNHGVLELGEIYPCQTEIIEDELIIANAVTQVFYGNKENHNYLDYIAVRSAFRKINDLAQLCILEVHMPALDQGSRWEIIEEIIHDEFNVDVGIWVDEES